MIIFSESAHSYLHLETGNKLYGWTSFIKKFTKSFDEENQLICSAYKILLGQEDYNKLVKSEFGRLYSLNTKEVAEYLTSSVEKDVSGIVDEIKYEWEYSKILGSKFHKKLEDRSYELGFEISPFTGKKYNTVVVDKEYDNQSICDNLFDLEDGYYPELLVWDNTVGQGVSPVTQIDCCFIETDTKGNRYVDVNDIKTNSRRPMPFKGEFMMDPLGAYNDDTVNKYKLQVMFGGKLMSTFGFIPRHMAFTHYLEYDDTKSKIYPAKYDSEVMDKLQIEWSKTV
jgi:hypothetical protein